MMDRADKNIVIGYDDCGFSIEIGDKIFESDYCGMPRESEIEVIKNALEHLGHIVIVKYAAEDYIY